MAALIVGDDAEALSQRADLVQPHAFAAGEAVQQHHGRAVAGIGDGDVQVADLDSVHKQCPPASIGRHEWERARSFTAQAGIRQKISK